MRKLTILLPLLLAGCGTFPLGHIEPQPGKTAEAQQLDILTCKDQATLAVSSAGHQAGDFMLGLTIIGLPAAFEWDKSTYKDTFSKCMADRGYRVIAAE